MMYTTDLTIVIVLPWRKLYPSLRESSPVREPHIGTGESRTFEYLWIVRSSPEGIYARSVRLDSESRSDGTMTIIDIMNRPSLKIMNFLTVKEVTGNEDPRSI
jgi:hypothetical protein